MNSTDYRDTLAKLGLTQPGAARFLGVNERTSRYWANDQRPIPEAVAMFLLYLVATKTKPAKVLKLLDKAKEKTQ